MNRYRIYEPRTKILFMEVGQTWREKEVPEAKWLRLEVIKIVRQDGDLFYFTSSGENHELQFSCGPEDIIPRYELIS